MRISLKVITFGSALIFATSALAATVASERGEVLVNRGSGYKLVTQPTPVAVGDQVMVKPKSSGRVTFPDGCTMMVAPGAIFTISAKSPCERAGGHIETVGSLPPKKDPQESGNDVVPFLTVVGVPVGMMLLPQKDKAASP
jgi:hypothetical protein